MRRYHSRVGSSFERFGLRNAHYARYLPNYRGGIRL